ncbi:MAG TPA: FtsQ-type POTRA domain-containing protein [Thermoleophilaceae bacterium]|nr:FtsQ-type POTRA domain-containing protein [Thermoleophilaceae bacterium]
MSGAGAYAGGRPGGKAGRGTAKRSAPRAKTRRRTGGRLLATVSPVRLLAILPARFRRRLTCLLAACLVLAAGYQFWLRDSPLVAVEDVAVTGLTTKDAPRLRAALASAARTMTTLHVEQSELERAIAAYPVVRELEVHPDFPHGLQIHVVEHRPAALVDGLPVAGDGTILRGLPVEGKLPTIDPAGKLSGDRLTDAGALHAAHVAGAAPGALRPRLEHVGVRSGEGIVVELRDGPELIFGNARHVRAKWIAATRVLADPESAGATYIDVTLPGRPAAGGLAAETLSPVAPAGSEDMAASPDATAPPESTIDPATEQLAPPATTAPETTPPDPATAPAPPAESAPAPAETVGGGAGPAPAE